CRRRRGHGRRGDALDPRRAGRRDPAVRHGVAAMKRRVPVRLLLRLAPIGAAAAAAACRLHGPRLKPVSHLANHEAVQTSEQRELLLNLVRLRHTDTPEFLAIDSIATQMQFDAAASLGASFGDDRDGGVRLTAPSAAAAYSESPTVTFSPLRDEAFTRR